MWFRGYTVGDSLLVRGSILNLRDPFECSRYSRGEYKRVLILSNSRPPDSSRFTRLAMSDVYNS